jgi:regulator of protease activity HflC (stomatin/prohibitin superfamily)
MVSLKRTRKKRRRNGFVPWLVVVGVGSVFVVAVIKSAVFTIHTKQAAIVERFGKFERVAGPGLNFKTLLIEKVVYTET